MNRCRHLLVCVYMATELLRTRLLSFCRHNRATDYYGQMASVVLMRLVISVEKFCKKINEFFSNA